MIIKNRSRWSQLNIKWTQWSRKKTRPSQEASIIEANRHQSSKYYDHRDTISCGFTYLLAIAFESETDEYGSAAAKFEKEVDTVQRDIAKVEDQLDIAISSTKETAEKLEIADKEAIDAELQVGALKRRLALLEEETQRSKDKLAENIEKCNATEQTCAANEDGRRAGEARSFAAESSLENLESELQEANAIATASNHKYEDVCRKSKVVEGRH